MLRVLLVALSIAAAGPVVAHSALAAHESSSSTTAQGVRNTRGYAKAWNAKTRTFTVQTNGSVKKDYSWVVPADVRVEIGSQPAKIEDIRLGYFCRVETTNGVVTGVFQRRIKDKDDKDKDDGK